MERSERPEMNSEETCGEKAKKSNRIEQRFDYHFGSQPNLRAYDNKPFCRKDHFVVQSHGNMHIMQYSYSMVPSLSFRFYPL